MADQNAGEFTGASCDWYDVPCHLSSCGEWMIVILMFLPRWLFQQLTDMVAEIVGDIPMPAELSQGFQPFFDAAGPGAVWIAEMCALQTGVELIVTAIAIRFGMRAIPGYG